MRGQLWLPRGRLASATVVGAAAVLVASIIVSGLAWAERIPDDVALRVADQDVTIGELNHRIVTLSAIYGVDAPDGGKKLDRFRRAAAKSMAVSTVLEQEARRRGIVIARKTLQDELTRIVEGQSGGERTSFIAFLAQKGLKEDDILDELRRARATERLYKQVTKDVPKASKASARGEYDKRRTYMRTAEQRRLANIVVETKADADEVMARLRNGEEFASVASATSLDTSTSGQGGDLGQAARQGELEPAYGKAAFAAKEGEVFGPVHTEAGWNIGKVLSVTPGKALSYKEVEPTLLVAITGRHQLATWTAWLNQRIAAAEVRYNEQFEPANPRVSRLDATEVGAR